MASTNPNTPEGLRPLRRTDSASYNGAGSKYVIPANTTDAIYIGDPVVKLHNRATTDGTYAGVGLYSFAAANTPVFGVVIGFSGVLAANSVANEESFYPFSGTPGNAYRPAGASIYDFYALIETDPKVLYEIQVSNTDVLATSAIGQTAGLFYTAGTQIAGVSGVTLEANSVSNAAAVVTILGTSPMPNNTLSQPYAKVLVQINQPTDVWGQPGV